MQEQMIHYLLDRQLTGKITEQEQQELAVLIQDADYELFVKEELVRLLAKEAGQDRGVEEGQGLAGGGGEERGQDQRLGDTVDETMGRGNWDHVLRSVLDVDKTASLKKMEGVDGTRVGEIRLRMGFRKWRVAAVLALIFAGGSFYYFNNKRPLPVAGHPMPIAQANIVPGTNQAILTLANGRQIVLKDAQNGVLDQQGGIRVIKLDSGRLAYNSDDENGGNDVKVGDKGRVGKRGIASGGPLYNTITTPIGGQYQVTLPDGTKVWLNAASSLRFPMVFTDKERAVQLTGEAYFEVATDRAKSFRVKAGTTETLVLGTHFNIMAYSDEGAIRTTLLEGAVKMEEGGESTVLQPGQQGDFEIKQGTLNTRMVNTMAVIAWKDGYYFFDRTPVQAVMRQVARWYNVDIEYQGGIPKDEIVGKIPRTAHVSDVLHIMELIGVRFKIEGRKIIVLS